MNRKRSPIKHFVEDQNRDLKFKEWLCPLCTYKMEETDFTIYCPACSFTHYKEFKQNELWE